jgi:hypothetical protein
MDREKVHKTMQDTTKLLLDAGLTGEEYLLVLQTLVAHVLTVNDISVKKVWLMNLNNDVRLRRIAALQVRSAN